LANTEIKNENDDEERYRGTSKKGCGKMRMWMKKY
jgi:hypothetical protein